MSDVIKDVWTQMARIGVSHRWLTPEQIWHGIPDASLYDVMHAIAWWEVNGEVERESVLGRTVFSIKDLTCQSNDDKPVPVAKSHAKRKSSRACRYGTRNVGRTG